MYIIFVHYDNMFNPFSAGINYRRQNLNFAKLYTRSDQKKIVFLKNVHQTYVDIITVFNLCQYIDKIHNLYYFEFGIDWMRQYD